MAKATTVMNNNKQQQQKARAFQVLQLTTVQRQTDNKSDESRKRKRSTHTVCTRVQWLQLTNFCLKMKVASMYRLLGLCSCLCLCSFAFLAIHSLLALACSLADKSQMSAIAIDTFFPLPSSWGNFSSLENKNVRNERKASGEKTVFNRFAFGRWQYTRLHTHTDHAYANRKKSAFAQSGR